MFTIINGSLQGVPWTRIASTEELVLRLHRYATVNLGTVVQTVKQVRFLQTSYFSTRAPHLHSITNENSQCLFSSINCISWFPATNCWRKFALRIILSSKISKRWIKLQCWTKARRLKTVSLPRALSLIKNSALSQRYVASLAYRTTWYTYCLQRPKQLNECKKGCQQGVLILSWHYFHIPKTGKRL